MDEKFTAIPCMPANALLFHYPNIVLGAHSVDGIVRALISHVMSILPYTVPCLHGAIVPKWASISQWRFRVNNKGMERRGRLRKVQAGGTLWIWNNFYNGNRFSIRTRTPWIGSIVTEIPLTESDFMSSTTIRLYNVWRMYSGRMGLFCATPLSVKSRNIIFTIYFEFFSFSLLVNPQK